MIFDRDVLLMIGGNVVGVGGVLIVIALVYRRSIALRLSLLTLGCIVLSNTITFCLGKYGVTWGRVVFGLALSAPVITAAMLILMRKIVQPAKQVAAVAEKIARGELNERLTIDSQDEFGDMARAINQMSAQLKNLVTQVKDAADHVAINSEAIQRSATQMSSDAASQSAATTEVSAALAEIALTIRQNAENAVATGEIALQAAEEALESSDSVTQALEALHQIAQKISVIDDISAQTRTLSLNASIEAARVQEHGKGFAVVAAEVRNLAGRSQVAANGITE